MDGGVDEASPLWNVPGIKRAMAAVAGVRSRRGQRDGTFYRPLQRQGIAIRQPIARNRAATSSWDRKRVARWRR